MLISRPTSSSLSPGVCSNAFSSHKKVNFSYSGALPIFSLGVQDIRLFSECLQVVILPIFWLHVFGHFSIQHIDDPADDMQLPDRLLSVPELAI